MLSLFPITGGAALEAHRCGSLSQSGGLGRCVRLGVRLGGGIGLAGISLFLFEKDAWSVYFHSSNPGWIAGRT